MTWEQINDAAQYIQSKTSEFKPLFGIILGTGLGDLIKEVTIEHTIDYADIPHFPVSTVESHSGKLHLGTLSGKKVVIMQGRFHHYEGYNMKQVVFPVQVMKVLGITKLFVSNAAGGISTDFELSDLMIINDHINILPENPLRGKNIEELGPRWVDMYETYSPALIEKGLDIAKKHNIPCHSGVYVSVPGPNLETKAEYRYLQLIGADAVGMSTVPEIIAARHAGIECFAISVITDLCYPEALEPVSIDKILEAAGKAEPNMTVIIKELIGEAE